MNRLKKVKPSPSYFTAIPEGARAEYEDRVSSFWVAGRPLLLQLSSYVRAEGEQVSASSRLQQRIEQQPGDWKLWSEGLHPHSGIDQATAECVDENHVLWIHTYLVWPHLTVYALISGPERDVRDSSNWASEAVKSIELALH